VYGTFGSSADASPTAVTMSGFSGPLGDVSTKFSAVTRNLMGSPANINKYSQRNNVVRDLLISSIRNDITDLGP
jgi:hypothetical protein